MFMRLIIVNNRYLFSKMFFLFAQIMLTVNYLRSPSLGFVGLINILIVPGMLILAAIGISDIDRLHGFVKDIDWRNLGPTISYKIISLFLFVFLVVFTGLVSLKANIHAPLMMLIVFLSSAYLLMLYFEFSGKLNRAAYIFFFCFPLLNLLEYWLGLNKETFVGLFVFTPTTFFSLSLFLGLIIMFFRKKIVLSGFQIMAMLCLFMLLGSGLISALFSVEPGRSFNEYVLQYLYPILMFPVVFFSIDSFEKIKKLSNVLIVSVTLSVGTFFYLVQRFGGGFSSLIGIYKASITSGLSSGILAILLMSVFPLVLFMIFSEKERLRKRMYFGILLAFTLLVFLSFSRSAVLAFLLGMFVLILFVRNRAFLLTIAVIGVFLFMISFSFLSNPALNRYASLARGLSFSSARVRLDAWSGSVAMIKDHSIFGIGAGMWDKYVANYCPTQHINLRVKGGNWARGYILDPHNMFLRIYLETGLLGIISWCSFIVLSIISAIKMLMARRKHFSERYYLGLSFLVFMIANIAHSMTNGDMFVGVLFMYGMIFWGICGMFFRATTLMENSRLK